MYKVETFPIHPVLFKDCSLNAMWRIHAIRMGIGWKITIELYYIYIMPEKHHTNAYTHCGVKLPGKGITIDGSCQLKFSKPLVLGKDAE